MRPRLLHARPRLLALAAALLTPSAALGYEFNDADRWSRTAVDGSGMVQGQPTTITWSLAPDGTTVPNNDGSGGTGSSQLISFFDTLYPGGSGTDLTQRPWFHIFDDSFSRWEELSGITFVYEDDDDGRQFSSLSLRRGIVDTRGDIRIGATPVDGQDGSNTIAFAYNPDYGEMVIDTDNTSLFGNTFNDYRAPRNVIMHELGHALGIEHLESNNAAFLMEPFVNVGFDGPQLDDILAIHRGYGDVYEKSNGGAGNDTAANATPLGLLIDQVTTSIGTDADDTVVGRTDTDFVSIDDNSDIDFYSFTIGAQAEVTITLTPKGPTYNSGPQDGTQAALDTAALSNLTLTLFDTDGSSQILLSNFNPAGVAESISALPLQDPGTYFIRVSGADNAPQLYQLDVLASITTPMPGDLDGDFDVDQDDLAIVLAGFSASVTPGSLIGGDATGDGGVGIDDLDTVLAHWTGTAQPVVPEPATVGLLSLGLMMLGRRRRVC